MLFRSYRLAVQIERRPAMAWKGGLTTRLIRLQSPVGFWNAIEVDPEEFDRLLGGVFYLSIDSGVIERLRRFDFARARAIAKLQSGRLLEGFQGTGSHDFLIGVFRVRLDPDPFRLSILDRFHVPEAFVLDPMGTDL